MQASVNKPNVEKCQELTGDTILTDTLCRNTVLQFMSWQLHNTDAVLMQNTDAMLNYLIWYNHRYCQAV